MVRFVLGNILEHIDDKKTNGQQHYEDDELDDDSDGVDEEDEESSEDEIDEKYLDDQDLLDQELVHYRDMMDDKLKNIRSNEKLAKQMNDLSVEEVVNMIENNTEACQDNQPKKKKKNKKKKKTEKQSKFEEEIEDKSHIDHKIIANPEDYNYNDMVNCFKVPDNKIHGSEHTDVKSKNIKEKPPNNFYDLQSDYIDEDQIFEEFKKKLEECVPNKERLIPNLTIDWVKSLRQKLIF
jgi:hypothetical protein